MPDVSRGSDRHDDHGVTLSVVVPARNCAPWITDCLRSILDQSVASCEVIVIDDGSADATQELVSAIAANDPRVQLHPNPGTGGAAARNFGATLAGGRYLAFADGDDLVSPDGYRAMIDSLERSGSELAVGDYLSFSPVRTWSRQSTVPIYGSARTGLSLEDEPELLRDRVCWNKLFLRQWWLGAQLRYRDARRSNDIVAMTEALLLARIDIVPSIVYLYRRAAGSGSMTAMKDQLEAIGDYVEQERACRELILAHGSAAVEDAYFRGLVRQKLWAHVAHFARLYHGASGPTRERVTAGIADLVDSVPDRIWEDVRPDQRWIHRLVADDRLDLAILLPHRDDRLASPRAYTEWTDAPLEAYRELERLSSPQIWATVLRGRFLPWLVAHGNSDDATLRSAADALVAFQRAHVSRVRLNSVELHLIDTAASGTLEQLRLALRVTRSGNVHGRLRGGVDGARLEVFWRQEELPELVPGGLLTRSTGLTRGPWQALASPQLRRGAVAYRLPPDWPAGSWDLAIQVRDVQGGSETMIAPPVLPPYRPEPLPSRGGMRLVRGTSDSTGLALEIASTLARRVRRRIRRLRPSTRRTASPLP